MKFKELFILVLVLIFIILVIQNTKAFPVKFLFWSFFMSQALWLILALFLGLSLGWVLTIRAKKRADELKSQKEKR